MPGWTVVAAFASFVALVIAWEVWEANIRPLFISGIEVNRLADEYSAKYGERAEEMAFINEDRAWRYSESFEQGKWRRVRKAIRRRRTAYSSIGLS